MLSSYIPEKCTSGIDDEFLRFPIHSVSDGGRVITVITQIVAPNDQSVYIEKYMYFITSESGTVGVVDVFPYLLHEHIPKTDIMTNLMSILQVVEIQQISYD